MIGIYEDDFLDYLKDTLGEPIKITSKNIITRCPWCEYQKQKDHYHMYISTEAPIFHCFHAGCEQSGTIRKFLKRIEGRDISESFIDNSALNEYKKRQVVFKDKDEKQSNISIPKIQIGQFKLKEFYIRKRLKFSNISIDSIKGLIYDVDKFIELNDIPVTESIFKLRPYLQNNFVGFLTEHNTTLVLRNIDDNSEFRYYKLKVRDSNFIDYYKLNGNNKNSTKIVLSEGIFDIFSEHIFDYLKLKHDVKLYASVLSSKYLALIKSIIYYEKVFYPDVIILSDRGIELNYYKNLKKYNKHIINSLTVYYNKAGKDFNDTPVIPQKFKI
jgi:hypothetical protein